MEKTGCISDKWGFGKAVSRRNFPNTGGPAYSLKSMVDIAIPCSREMTGKLEFSVLLGQPCLANESLAFV
jgi:hypothetical protein